MKKILVVDDDKKIRDMYTRFLSSKGFTVEAVASTEEAHQTLLNCPVDLVLLDINMPRVDGIVMYQLMKSFHAKTKLIIASVYPREVQRTLIEKANDYYDKSEGLDVLLQKIQEVMKNGQES